MKSKTSLFLTGGGARGAYQAGVIKGIASFYDKDNNPFPILTGTSAGAINCSYIASHISEKSFQSTAQDLSNLWGNLSSEDILQTNPFKIFGNGGKWLTILMGGGFSLNNSHNISLLLNENLKSFLEKNIQFNKINQSLKNKKLDAIGITCLCYEDSITKTFFDSSNTISNWERNLRQGIKSELKIEHVLSSASIPIIFPSYNLAGKFYGDGSIRNFAPLSAAIKLGADKIIIINVKAKRSPIIINPQGPSLAQILGTLLHGLMLDNLEADIERVESINQIIDSNEDNLELKKVKTLLISPSKNIGDIAAEEFKSLPRSLKFLFKGLGNPTESSDLISYLLFEKNFTSRLVKLGYEDAIQNQEKILSFIS